MIRVVLLGGGNLALHLFQALQASTEVTVVQLYNRSLNKVQHLNHRVVLTDNLADIAAADLYIIAVTDDAITGVAAALKSKNGLVVHTSGSASMEALNQNPRRGSFYPLQTFTMGQKVDFKQIPICLEANNPADLAVLQQVAAAISDAVFEISSEQRQSLHLAAVFVNNFTNHLYTLGQEICLQHKLSFDLLKPLIRETVHKIETTDPYFAQTGPAKRNDETTLARHEKQLQKEYHLEIYKLLSASIKNTYGKKL